jgi:hypothetical protein
MTWSMSWQHTSLLCRCAVHGGEGNSLPCHGSIPACCAGVWYTVEKGTPFSTMYRTPAQQAGMLPWHWPRHEWRGYRIITVVLAKHKNGSLMMVPTWTETCRNDLGIFNCFNIPVILWLCASVWNNKSALILLMHGTNMKIILAWYVYCPSWHQRSSNNDGICVVSNSFAY